MLLLNVWQAARSLMTIEFAKILGISKNPRVEVLELNVQPDHVHMVLSIPPKYSVSEVMGFLKGKLALGMCDHFPELKRRYWGRHVWSRGYCVTTVGLDEEAIRKYVRWQNK